MTKETAEAGASEPDYWWMVGYYCPRCRYQHEASKDRGPSVELACPLCDYGTAVRPLDGRDIAVKESKP